MRVRTHAAIWSDNLLVINREQRRGSTRFILPGGRVNDRESVTDALRREMREELGVEAEIGDLLLCAEVVSAASHHELELVFAVTPLQPLDELQLDLVDPADPHVDVLPRVLPQLASVRDGAQPGLWLGNIYDGRLEER